MLDTDTQPFIRPEGHTCSTSLNSDGYLTIGSGELYDNGFWSKPCQACARAHEGQFPSAGPVWPHAPAQLEAMRDKQ